MSLIWNNKEYKLVSDDNEWDRLEFVVARKLHLQYIPTQTISIDLIKKSFAIYGAIEKIEIFRDNKTKHQFAHVTFKESRASYLALIDCKENLEIIRPAHAFQQPDSKMDLTKSSFYNLPDKCLVDIFKKLDVPALANLSVVCKKLCKLLRDHIFVKMQVFEAETKDESDVMNAMTTVNRILQCLQPEAFHMKIYRNLKNSHKWPTVFLDFNYTEKSRLSIDMSFLKRKWLCKLEPTTSLMKSIHIRYTIYDDSLVALPYKPRNEIMWPNVSTLIISGFSKKKSLPDFSAIVAALPKLEDLFIRNMYFDYQMKDYCQGINLRNMIFENCLFKSEMAEKQIWTVVAVLKGKKKTFPLCIKFDRMQFFKTESFDECCNDFNNYNEMYYLNSLCNPRYFQRQEQRKRKFVSCDESSYGIIKKIVNDDVAQKYIRIEIGDDPFDQTACGSATGRKRRFDDCEN